MLENTPFYISRNKMFELSEVCNFVYYNKIIIYKIQDVIQYMYDFQFQIYYCFISALKMYIMLNCWICSSPKKSNAVII